MAKRIRESAELGAFLARKFKPLHITQKELAEKLNLRIGSESHISQTLISRLLGDEASLDLDSPLADALCTELSFNKADLDGFLKPEVRRSGESWVSGVVNIISQHGWKHKKQSLWLFGLSHQWHGTDDKVPHDQKLQDDLVATINRGMDCHLVLLAMGGAGDSSGQVLLESLRNRLVHFVATAAEVNQNAVARYQKLKAEYDDHKRHNAEKGKWCPNFLEPIIREGDAKTQSALKTLEAIETLSDNSVHMLFDGGLGNSRAYLYVPDKSVPDDLVGEHPFSADHQHLSYGLLSKLSSIADDIKAAHGAGAGAPPPPPLH